MASLSSPQFPPLFAPGSAHSQPSSSTSEMLSISSVGSTSPIPPVIIHLTSAQKVSSLGFLELSSFSDSLSVQVGMVTSSSFLSGNDLSVRPSDESQKDKLLALESPYSRQISGFLLSPKICHEPKVYYKRCSVELRR